MSWMWPREKFINRKYVMQEMFENYTEGDDWKVAEVGGIKPFYYPPEVRRGKYWGLGVFLLEYFPLVKIRKPLHYNAEKLI